MSLEHLFSLSGAVALVTGAGAGIGRATALRFAEAGAAIVVTDIKAETAQSVASAITAAGGKAVGLACDVTRKRSCKPPSTPPSLVSGASRSS